MAIRRKFQETERKERALAKPEWGTKRICGGCGAKFYDFRRAPIVCPKCDTKITPASATRPKRNRGARPEPAAVEKPKPASDGDEVAAQADDIEDGDDADGDVDDDKLLDDDDDPEGGIIDVKPGGDKEDKES